jgi:Bacterial capsule synthesis protein PGA_cap
MKSFFLYIICLSISIPSFASPEDIRFQKACDEGDTILIGAVGDVLLHSPLQRQGLAKGFDSLWSEVEPWIGEADLFYANFEGPADDSSSYTGYPQFNYPSTAIDALKQSGVDILSTANNHSLDRRSAGAIETLAACERYGMPCFGTRADKDQDFYTITNTNGWSIAWIACTFSTNGIPDKNDLVLDCFSTGRVSELIARLKNQVNAVIVTPHWGNEYETSPNSQQKSFARKWLDEGATAIIGTHPHVPQPWEKYTTSSGEEKFILYSSGNFVSNQQSTKKQTGLMLFLGLTQKDGKAWVNGVRYLPLYMSRGPYSVVPANGLENRSEAKSASLQFAQKMYGEERIVNPGENIVTNAECGN